MICACGLRQGRINADRVIPAGMAVVVGDKEVVEAGIKEGIVKYDVRASALRCVEVQAANGLKRIGKPISDVQMHR